MSAKFKLITGMGLSNEFQIETLISAYAPAGVDIIDSCATAMPLIQTILKNKGYDLNNFDFCVSVPIKGDVHGKKAKINPKKCNLCKVCEKFCPQGAINPPYIDKSLCIGCTCCKNSCAKSAISFYDNEYSGFNNFLNSSYKLDTVEVHVCVNNLNVIKKEFKKIINKVKAKNCKISVCLSRKYFSNTTVENLLLELKEISSPLEFFVQTDGNTMNGGKDDFSSTIEAVAFGLFCKELGYNVILSGGCNQHTSDLAYKAGFEPIIAFGGYARKIIKDLNENDAKKAASDFVKSVKMPKGRI